MGGYQNYLECAYIFGLGDGNNITHHGDRRCPRVVAESLLVRCPQLTEREPSAYLQRQIVSDVIWIGFS